VSWNEAGRSSVPGDDRWHRVLLARAAAAEGADKCAIQPPATAAKVLVSYGADLREVGEAWDGRQDRKKTNIIKPRPSDLRGAVGLALLLDVVEASRRSI